MKDKPTTDQIRDAVKKHYAEAITSGAGCCGPGASSQFVQLSGYTPEDLAGVPEGALSFGCGNPVNFAGVKEGQTVLDLGSGAGLDLILAARKVGPQGRVIGLDMTDEMIATCRRNLEQAGVTNAQVRQGLMEKMPVADNEVDWIISNCVINLSPEKEKVFAESFRVLKPGGHLLVSDIVTRDLPKEVRDDIQAWVGCIAGAVDEDVYLEMLRKAGFTNVEVMDRMVYGETALKTLATDACCGETPSTAVTDALIEQCADRIASVKVYAEKPE
jgi:SAM-dependent methyltransferase